MKGAGKDLVWAIGIVTAVVGLGKLIYEGWPSFSDVLPWLGAAYLAIATVGFVYWLVKPRSDLPRWHLLLSYAGVFVGFTVFSIKTSLHELLVQVGVGGLATVALVGGARYLQHWKQRPSMKPCPDCAEQVKEPAKVCRHCGHRFKAAAS